jgi:predicted metal-binding membrane protein
MATAFAVGLMNLVWMLVLAGLAAAEQHLPAGERLASIIGLTMAAWGVRLLL